MAIVTIVGAGLMGTATAWPLVDNRHQVRLVGTHLDRDIIQSCLDYSHHPRLKRNLPEGVQPYFLEDIAEALAGADIVVSGVNSSGVHWIGRTLAPHLKSDQLIIAVTKGLEVAENGEILTLPEILRSELPSDIRQVVKLAAIGGPCIAGELAGRRQSCVVFGCADAPALERLAKTFHTPYYHIWTTHDLFSLEVSAALKNAYTLGVGLVSLLEQGVLTTPTQPCIIWLQRCLPRDAQKSSTSWKSWVERPHSLMVYLVQGIFMSPLQVEGPSAWGNCWAEAYPLIQPAR
jgi:glycerol-3-phosphate dehydrogenase (NAD(P)+)